MFIIITHSGKKKPKPKAKASHVQRAGTASPASERQVCTWAGLAGEGGGGGLVGLSTCDKNTQGNTPADMRAQAGTFPGARACTHTTWARSHASRKTNELTGKTHTEPFQYHVCIAAGDSALTARLPASDPVVTDDSIFIWTAVFNNSAPHQNQTEQEAHSPTQRQQNPRGYVGQQRHQRRAL